MRLYRPPKVLHYIFPEARFSFPGIGRTLYLSFDDGPTEGITQRLIEILQNRGVPATFFVSGIHVEEEPELFESIKSGGFAIGNHGYLHLNGFKTDKKKYIENVVRGAEVCGSGFFRPPYGKITPGQYQAVLEKYRIVFWSIMPYDYDNRLSADAVLKVLKNGIRPGSIIALHDNARSLAPLILGEFIDYCISKGYSFDSLDRLNLRG